MAECCRAITATRLTAIRNRPLESHEHKGRLWVEVRIRLAEKLPLAGWHQGLLTA